MFDIETLDSGIVRVAHHGIFTPEYWEGYKTTLVEILDASTDGEPVYILSDFRDTEKFSAEIVPQAGTAPHLTHPNLGMIVLLGGNALQNFILQITNNRASKESRGDKMRVHWEYDRAMTTLKHFQQIHKAAKSSGSS